MTYRRQGTACMSLYLLSEGYAAVITQVSEVQVAGQCLAKNTPKQLMLTTEGLPGHKSPFHQIMNLADWAWSILKQNLYSEAALDKK